MPKYNVITLGDRIIEISQPSSTTLVYRLPFEKVGKKTADIIQNNFIVYILFGRNAKGKDVVYVGKSKNNIISRPRQHKDKFSDWTDCYVLTQFKERTFLNDGTIQYLENQISTKVDTFMKIVFYLKVCIRIKCQTSCFVSLVNSKILVCFNLKMSWMNYAGKERN